MPLKTSDLIHPDTISSISLVAGTKPFPIIGLDLAHKALFFALFNTRNHVVTIHVLGRTLHL